MKRTKSALRTKLPAKQYMSRTTISLTIKENKLLRKAIEPHSLNSYFRREALTVIASYLKKQAKKKEQKNEQ